jgi:SAM-dependent methyltransferase
VRPTLRPDGLLEVMAKHFNLGPLPVAEVFLQMASSRAIMAGVKLGVFARLALGAVSSEVLARELAVDFEGCARLLAALESIGYVRLRKGKWQLAARMRPWLDPASSRYVGGFIEFNLAQWEWWSTLEEKVRTGKGEDIHAYGPDDPRWRAYMAAMFDLARIAAPEIARRIRLPRGATSVLDLGGGHGAYGAELCRRNPKLIATVMDLPPSARAGRSLLEARQMATRVRHVEGDVTRDGLGGPHDAVLCFQLLHHLTEAQAKALLRRVAKAMKPGGKLAVLEFFAASDGTVRGPEALIGLHYFVTSSARVWSREALEQWLAEAGFESPRYHAVKRLPPQVLCVATRGE